MIWGALGGAVGCAKDAQEAPPPPSAPALAPAAETEPVGVWSVSPHTTSNETAQPLLVFGKGLAAARKVKLGAPFDRVVALRVVDDGHGAFRLPTDLDLPAATVRQTVAVTLLDDNGVAVGSSGEIVLVNDRAFPDLAGLLLDAMGQTAFSLSSTTDELYAINVADGAKEAIATKDAPTAMALARIGGAEFLVVVHRYTPEILLVATAKSADGVRLTRSVPAPAFAQAVAVDKETAYVAEIAADELVAVSLKDGAEQWRVETVPNVRGIAVVPPSPPATTGFVAVGSLVAGEIQLVSMKDGAVSAGIAPRPNVPILGGHTEDYRQYVMGGKGVRALAFGLGKLFVASSGPNVGPNPKQMGTSPTGGTGVVDPKTLTYARHLAFDFGVPQAFAFDAKRNRLYVADVGEGLVRVVDAKALVDKDEKLARAAHLAMVALPLPKDFPLMRPAEDFGVNNRAGVEAHTGPSALALSRDGKTLFVLERFTGRITLLDVGAATPQPTVLRSISVVDPLTQRERRLGQIVYYTDIGRTGMSCDVCHLDGHTEGVFFTKTDMMRIWRSPTVRGTVDTPPYFNPPSHPTLEDTADYVGSRNRFANPPMSPSEVRYVSAFTMAMTTPPNPFREADGSMKAQLPTGAGHEGSPARGEKLFQSRCQTCHPPPLFATDFDPKTRRRFMKPGTPEVLPIRVDQQNLTFKHRTPPSLVGAWDMWPMLLSAAAGFAVSASGDYLEARDHDPLRAVVERYSGPEHGNAQGLSDAQREDIIAYVKSL